MEKGIYPREIAQMYGVSEEYVRAATHRAASKHPLPHTRSGEKRPHTRIRPSVFEQWYVEEEQSTCA